MSQRDNIININTFQSKRQLLAENLAAVLENPATPEPLQDFIVDFVNDLKNQTQAHVEPTTPADIREHLPSVLATWDYDRRRSAA